MTKVEQCASKAELRDKLRRFYPTVNPAKLGDVDSLVERYFLRQPDLNTLLKGLYKKDLSSLDSDASIGPDTAGPKSPKTDIETRFMSPKSEVDARLQEALQRQEQKTVSYKAPNKEKQQRDERMRGALSTRAAPSPDEGRPERPRSQQPSPDPRIIERKWMTPDQEKTLGSKMLEQSNKPEIDGTVTKEEPNVFEVLLSCCSRGSR